MLEKRFADLSKVISETGKLFESDIRVPLTMPARWLSDFKKGRLDVSVGENMILAIEPRFFHKIKIDLTGSATADNQALWLAKMNALRINKFDFTASGRVHKLESVPASKDTAEESEDDFQCPRCGAVISDDPEYLDECPVCKKTLEVVDCDNCNADVWVDARVCPECKTEFEMSKCPHCSKELIANAFDACPYCDADLYVCPVCGEYIDQDPQDAEFCPVCRKSMILIACPNCDEDIGADSEKCEECGYTFTLTKCPCDDCAKPLIASNAIGTCPYCDASIKYAKCPDCHKEFYMESE